VPSPEIDAVGEPPPGNPIRDAATIILTRRMGGVPHVLMGQRGAAAAFMPSRFVFPGGVVDPGDLGVWEGEPDDAETRFRLAVGTPPKIARALPFTALRELWEEAGISIGRPHPDAAGMPVPEVWRGFFALGLKPDVTTLRLVFRAITPVGRPRRFDARFFLADADALGIAEAETAGDGELSCLDWLAIDRARTLPLPFITGIVMSELEARFREPEANHPVPFFDHGDRGTWFRML
jgi:8-oxo-dGTP pyrophosphatase MutT (NUDIX family)